MYSDTDDELKIERDGNLYISEIENKNEPNNHEHHRKKLKNFSRLQKKAPEIAKKVILFIGGMNRG